MSTSMVISVNCDKCEEVFHGHTGEKARPVRADAKAAGWKVGKSKDFCPSCKEQIKQAVKEAASGN